MIWEPFTAIEQLNTTYASGKISILLNIAPIVQ